MIAPLSIYPTAFPLDHKATKTQKLWFSHLIPTRAVHGAWYEVCTKQFCVDLNVYNDPSYCKPKWQLFKNQRYPFRPAQAVTHQDTRLSKLRMDWISALLLPSQTQSPVY